MSGIYCRYLVFGIYLIFLSTIYLIFRLFYDCVFGGRTVSFLTVKVILARHLFEMFSTNSSMNILLRNFCFCLVSQCKNLFPHFKISLLCTTQICPNLPRQWFTGITHHHTDSTVQYTTPAPFLARPAAGRASRYCWRGYNMIQLRFFLGSQTLGFVILRAPLRTLV